MATQNWHDVRYYIYHERNGAQHKTTLGVEHMTANTIKRNIENGTVAKIQSQTSSGLRLKNQDQCKLDEMRRQLKMDEWQKQFSA